MIDTDQAASARLEDVRAMAAVRAFAAEILLPATFYLASFVALTGGLILQFSTRFFCDDGDGLQNVWNLWWVDRSLTVLHQSPWWTSALHYPHGTSLVGHTLNPFNGFVATGLLRFFTLVQAHNTIVIFSFVGGGVGAYLLARYLARGRPAAFLAGFIFTFSNYHFAHATGHLQLVSLEWIPVFVLALLRLLDRPRPWGAIGAAVTLALVLLCDYYYFFFCVLGGAMLIAITAWQRGDWLFLLRRPHRRPALIFAASALLACGPLVVALLMLGLRGVEGSHLARDFSLDLFGLLIPGAHWRYAALTRFYWESLPGDVHESSVHLGLAACTLLALSLIRGKPWARPDNGTASSGPMPHFAALWFVVASFAVLSLGPVLHIRGAVVPFIRLPYSVLSRLLPPLRMSGCPVRMTVFVVCAASPLIAAEVERMLSRRAGGGAAWQRIAAVALLALLVIEFLPRPLPTVGTAVPRWVDVLAAQPKRYALYDIDGLQKDGAALYYQTVHRMPMVGGYISRVPSPVAARDRVLDALARAKNLKTLCERYGVGYVLARPMAIGLPQLYADGRLSLYDLTREWQCRPGPE